MHLLAISSLAVFSGGGAVVASPAGDDARFLPSLSKPHYTVGDMRIKEPPPSLLQKGQTDETRLIVW